MENDIKQESKPVNKPNRSQNADFPKEVIMGVERKLRYDTSRGSPVYYWRNLGVNASKWLYMNFANLKEDNKIKVCLKILDKLAPDQVHIQGQAGLQGLLAEMSRRSQELNIENKELNIENNEMNNETNNETFHHNLREDIENKEDTENSQEIIT